ncbi:GGDEF domain-containing protein [Pseudoalteromonas phenolica]|nr:GGDEF domain-containing protein [Pseudoalteromonas phenolica]
MMKKLIYLAFLSLCLFLATVILGNNPLISDASEELFWFTCIGLLSIYSAKYVSNKFLMGAWVFFSFGLLLDLLDELIPSEVLPILVFDTSIKNIGLILTSFVLYNVIHDERKLVEKLNFEIDKRKKLEEKLSYEANHDHLTKLGNRKSCFENFENITKTLPFLLYFDLDNFKIANDKFGHKTGDKVLVDITQSMCDSFGQNNCFRLGGDEFIAFSKAYPQDIELLRRTLLEPIFEFGVGISIGVAKAEDGLTPDEIMHLADENMYKDKAHKIIRHQSRT